MRPVWLPLAVLVFSMVELLPSGCSSSSSLQGGGGCESFCSHWVGAHCRSGPSMDDCMLDCTTKQSACPDESNALMRCATLEANIACETGSGEPRIVGCAPRQTAQAACLACNKTCTAIVTAACTGSPSAQECQAACTDSFCNDRYQRFVDCNPGAPTCVGSEMHFGSCDVPYFDLKTCVAPGNPFFVHAAPDAGTDTGADDTAVDSGELGFDAIGGFP